ncbi:MAG: RelA/SpoT AH/RIS domain-containing protein, partial [Pseudomonadota bacterium]
MAFKYAKTPCPACRPLPGDRIVGIVDEEKDVAVHVIDCPKLEAFEGGGEVWRDLQ